METIKMNEVLKALDCNTNDKKLQFLIKSDKKMTLYSTLIYLQI